MCVACESEHIYTYMLALLKTYMSAYTYICRNWCWHMGAHTHIYIRHRALREGRARVFYLCSPTSAYPITQDISDLIYMAPPEQARPGFGRPKGASPPPGPPLALPGPLLGPTESPRCRVGEAKVGIRDRSEVLPVPPEPPQEPQWMPAMATEMHPAPLAECRLETKI